MKIPKKNIFSNLILLISVLWTINFIFSAISQQNFNPSYLIVYLSPILFSFHNGYHIAKKLNLYQITSLIAFPLSLFCILHISFSFISMGIIPAIVARLNENIFNIIGIYQMRIYFPSIVATTIFLQIGKLLFNPSIKHKLLNYLCLVPLFLESLFLASREGLLSIISCTFITLLLFKRSAIKKILLILGILLTFLFIAYEIEIKKHITLTEITFIERFMSFKKNIDNHSPGGRLEEWSEGIRNIKKTHIITGEGFIIQPIRKTPHNQYIDLIQKSGLISFLVFFLFLIALLTHTHKSTSKEKYILFPLLLNWTILSLMVNTPLRAPLTASLMWFIFGYAAYNKNKDPNKTTNYV